MEAVLKNAPVFEILLEAEDDSKLGNGGSRGGGVPIDFAQLSKRLTEKLGVDVSGLIQDISSKYCAHEAICKIAYLLIKYLCKQDYYSHRKVVFVLPEGYQGLLVVNSRDVSDQN